MSAPPLLSIRGLHLDFQTSRGTVHVLRDVDLNIPRNRIVGLVGESGSGKSTLALAILNLLPSNTVRFDGTMDFDGVNLRELSPEQMRRYRGDRISMIFQDPMTALNPVFTIGTHLIDVQRAKGGGHSRAALRARALAMLNQVGIADAEQRLKAYPHQFSGGMRQRIMIAMALLTEPDLLIADEPTTALDVTIEAQIVRLIRDLRETFKGSIIFISHSLGLVSELCDDVVVMYAGTVVETGSAVAVFNNPRHPYTQALLACEVTADGGGRRLNSIPGEVPGLLEVPAGCIFAERCGRAEPRCTAELPVLTDCGRDHHAACLFV